MNKTMIRYTQLKPKRKAPEDYLIENIGNSLAWICLGVLEGKTEEFEFKTRKLNNFFKFIQDEKDKGEIKSDTETALILEEAKGKRSYIYETCQKIPFSQLLKIADVGPKQSSKNINLKAYLQAGFCIVCVWTDRVLQEHYRFNKSERAQVFETMIDWIDSYQKGYLSNKGINEMFIEDIGYDMEKGEFVG